MPKTQMFVPGPPVGRRRRRRAGAAATPPAAQLALVAATYDKDTPSVDLEFDRAIDIGAMDVAQVIVDDDTFTGARLVGFETAVLVNATTVRVPLNPVGGVEQPDVFLTVGAGNGIVAVDDGGTWAGVTNEPLPFP
jgi:hypothetical protein